MEEMGGWSARSLARLIGVPPQTVQHWVASGLIVPEKVGRGRGGIVIGLHGLMEAVTILELRRGGFSLQKIREAVENLRRLATRERPLTCLTLVAMGNELAWKTGDELAEVTISALRQPGQALFVFPVGERHEALIRQLDGVPADPQLQEPFDQQARTELIVGSGKERRM